jgi:IclR family acetate operon transcriptional repressor
MKQRFNSARYPGTQAVVRAVAILKALASSGELGITELAGALTLSKATVFRLLGALERDAMVARDPATETYRLGPALIALGAHALRSTDLRAASHDELVALAEETGEAATIEILVAQDTLILDEVQGRFILGTTPELGTHWPAHTTSTGKVLLAAIRYEGTPAEWDAALPARLVKRTPRTITSRERLERELARIWRQGYAAAIEEIEPGFVAIGAPVRNHNGRVIAALSIGGPVVRLQRPRIPEVAALVRRSADRVSLRLGATSAMLALPARSRERAAIG